VRAFLRRSNDAYKQNQQLEERDDGDRRRKRKNRKQSGCISVGYRGGVEEALPSGAALATTNSREVGRVVQHRRTPSVGPLDNFGPRRKGIEMDMINVWARRVVAWVVRVALLCLGLFAMLTLVVTVAVLMPVMLAATAFAAITVRQKRPPRARRQGGGTSKPTAPRTVVAFQGRQKR
jgi:hypothetical protein